MIESILWEMKRIVSVNQGASQKSRCEASGSIDSTALVMAVGHRLGDRIVRIEWEHILVNIYWCVINVPVTVTLGTSAELNIYGSEDSMTSKIAVTIKGSSPRLVGTATRMAPNPNEVGNRQNSSSRPSERGSANKPRKQRAVERIRSYCNHVAA
jgi:hypothetical protein